MVLKYKKGFEELVDLSGAFFQFPKYKLDLIVEETVPEVANSYYYSKETPYVLVESVLEKAMRSFDQTKKYINKVEITMGYGMIQSKSARSNGPFLEYSITEAGVLSIFGVNSVMLDKIEKDKVDMDDMKALSDVVKDVVLNIFSDISILSTYNDIYGQPDTLVREFILDMFFLDQDVLGIPWRRHPGETHETAFLKLGFMAGKRPFNESFLYTGGFRNAIASYNYLSDDHQEKLAEFQQRLAKGWVLDLEKVYAKAESLLLDNAIHDNGTFASFPSVSTSLSIVSRSCSNSLPGLGRGPYLETEEYLVRPIGPALTNRGFPTRDSFYSILTFESEMGGDMAGMYLDLFHDAFSPNIIEVAERNYDFFLKQWPHSGGSSLLKAMQRTIMSL